MPKKRSGITKDEIRNTWMIHTSFTTPDGEVLYIKKRGFRDIFPGLMQLMTTGIISKTRLRPLLQLISIQFIMQKLLNRLKINPLKKLLTVRICELLRNR